MTNENVYQIHGVTIITSSDNGFWKATKRRPRDPWDRSAYGLTENEAIVKALNS